MRAAADEDDYRRDPVGAFFETGLFAVFCTPELCGFTIWGRPERSDMERLVSLLAIELGPPVPRHDSIVDASRLEGVDAGAFDVLTGYISAHREALARQVARLAIARPPGLSGATVSGLFQVVDAPYPVEICATPGEGIDWLGRSNTPVAADFAALIDRAMGRPAVVIELARVLDAQRRIGPAAAAHALGLSLRSLQRRLSEAGTTFQDERAHAQVRAAQRLLLESDAPLTAIAFEVGCASLQNFSVLFRRVVGEAPSAWRARNRG